MFLHGIKDMMLQPRGEIVYSRIDLGSNTRAELLEGV